MSGVLEEHLGYLSLPQRLDLYRVAVEKLVRPDDRVVDAGCGTAALARQTGHGKITGIDSAASMCQQAQPHQWQTVHADMLQLPFADGAFDVVFSSLALQWSPDWRHSLQEWRRVLKPSGVLVFSTFVAGTLCELEESFAQVDDYPHISVFASPDTMNNTLKSFHREVRCEQQLMEEHFPSLKALALRLKGLGARNKHLNVRRGLMTPTQFRRVEKYYCSKYADEKGLRVSWQLLLTTARRG